jgi:hypothetical protein
MMLGAVLFAGVQLDGYLASKLRGNLCHRAAQAFSGKVAREEYVGSGAIALVERNANAAVGCCLRICFSHSGSLERSFTYRVYGIATRRLSNAVFLKNETESNDECGAENRAECHQKSIMRGSMLARKGVVAWGTVGLFARTER